ncbi:MAG: DoxX family protein [Acidimicrobiales bacterium]
MSSIVLAATAARDSTDGLDAGLLLLRLVVGLILAAHGLNKFFGGGKIPGTARWFDSMGMKPNGRVHALAAATTETGAGLLFAAGLLTPLASAGFIGLMIVAAWTVHRPNGFFIVKEGWEYNLVLATIAAAVASTGPGRFSLDDALGLDFAFTPKVALPLAVGLGVVAGVGLLASCYRPPAPSNP